MSFIHFHSFDMILLGTFDKLVEPSNEGRRKNKKERYTNIFPNHNYIPLLFLLSDDLGGIQSIYIIT